LTKLQAKTRLLGVVAALASGGLVAGQAQAADTLVWTAHSSGGLTTLVYGPVDPAAEPLFLLSCFGGMNIAVLDVHRGIPRVEPGQPLTIELSSATAKASIAGEVARDEETGATFGEASSIAVKPVLEVLRHPGEVTIAMGETTATLPEQGRAEAVASFTENCKLD
jgi:hypothetical protein